MQMNVSSRLIILCLVVAPLIVSCSYSFDKDGPQYKRSRSVPDLELPPDLRPEGMEDAMAVPGGTDHRGTATLSNLQNGNGARGNTAVLPEHPSIQVERDGDKRWLVIQAEPGQLWPRLREFWLENGFLIAVEEPSAGVLETEWAENRADIPGGPIRNVMKKVIDFAYSAPTRDKFRVRLERSGQPGYTEIYLTHRGMEEVLQGSDLESSEVSKWRSRPPDPELEAEMLSRLMVYLGAEQDRAKQHLAQQVEDIPRAHLIKGADGSSELVVDEEFSRAWRVTGVALDRVGFAVEDRNRSDGLYFVRYDDPLKAEDDGGMVAKLAFWKDDQPEDGDKYQIKLVGEGERTRITIRNARGERENSSTAVRILTLLHEQLR